MGRPVRNSVARARRLLIATGLASALVVTACTGDPTTSAPSAAAGPGASGGSGEELPGADVPPPVYSAMPVPPGQIDAAVQRVPGFVEAAMEETGIPGIAVAVVHDGEVVFAEGYGVADVNTGVPVDADTAFQVASLSKSVGATVMAQEVGKGTFAWDDPIAPELPGFELADPYITEHVSYADMYSHRSGLPSHIGDTLEDLGYDRAEVLARLRYAPLDPFRAQDRYTNFGLTAAAEAGANAAGLPWEELSARNLYGPLSMENTTSSYQEFLANPNRASLHVETDNGWEQLNTRDPDAQTPAGGVSSSANDLAKWMNLILADGEHEGAQLVDPKALAQTLTPTAPGTPPKSLDTRAGSVLLGFDGSVTSTAHAQLNHSGAFAMGAGTNYQMVPAERLGIVVLTNGSPLGVAETISAQFMDMALIGSLSRDWLPAYKGLLAPALDNPATLTEAPPTDPGPALADEEYVGSYANDYYGTAEVAAGADGLVLKIGPDLTEYPMTHWDGNQFTWIAPGENSPGPSLITFAPTATGATMEIVSLNEIEPLGVFTR